MTVKEKITFLDPSPPKLKAGRYTLSANVHLGLHGQAAGRDTGTTVFEPLQKEFVIDGPHFAIDPADIYATYPTEGQTGNYVNTLPHIVFSRPGLPWELPFGPETNGGRSRPWMCLLVVDEAQEKLISRKTVRPEELWLKTVNLRVPEADPLQKKVYGLPGDKKIEVADIPWPLFKECLPESEVLQMLAHVKLVELDDRKEQHSISQESTGATACFSTLIGHIPIPATSTQTRFSVLLVSLEGHWSLYDKAPLTREFVRVPLLYSWSFYTQQGADFKVRCEQISCGLLRSHLEPAHETARQVLDRGHVPLLHHTLNGLKRMSLYRGPLGPDEIPPPANPTFFTSAHEALHYDPDTGMFDVSYASAWQLGRLLALRDLTFAKELVRWKQQHIVLEREQKRFESLRPWLGAGLSGGKDPGIYTALSTGKLSEHLFKKDPGMDAYDPESTGFRAASPEFTPSMTAWLKNLASLAPVPANYLFPHPSLLPEESISIFMPDAEWIDALMSGALSLSYTMNSYTKLSSFRQPPEGKSGAYELRSGFVMRSSLLPGWKGIKVEARGATGEKKGMLLTPMRIEFLQSDLLFCLFDAEIAEITIVQPVEGLHFGSTTRIGKEKIADEQHNTPAKLAGSLIAKPLRFSFGINLSRE